MSESSPQATSWRHVLRDRSLWYALAWMAVIGTLARLGLF